MLAIAPACEARTGTLKMPRPSECYVTQGGWVPSTGKLPLPCLGNRGFVEDGTTEALVLLLQFLQTLQPVGLHAAIFLAPAMKRHFAHAIWQIASAIVLPWLCKTST